MSRTRFRHVLAVTILALGASAGPLAWGGPASAGAAHAGAVSAGEASRAQSGAGDCIAHHPNSTSGYDIWYAQGCSGHDEPELDPVSSLPGSAQDLTWTAVLPTDGPFRSRRPGRRSGWAAPSPTRTRMPVRPGFP